MGFSFNPIFFNKQKDFYNEFRFLLTYAAIKAMLETCGLEILSEPEHEVYITKKNPDMIHVASGWNKAEYLAAIGKSK